MARVVLAMSGGVDSSVAAHLLVQQGHEVIGVFMRHGEEAMTACSLDGTKASSPLLPVLDTRADHKQGCCSASDAEDARRVADRLNIPFYALNLKADFKQIIDYFVDEYVHARTPNPCVMCNNHLKFGKLFDYADSIDAPFVATGHYARLADTGVDEVPALLRGVDQAKDQSYVLFGVKRDYLKRMLLPVGGFHKPQIREMAEQIGLRVADKKDSQEICFVTSGKHDQFVKERKGNRDTAGEVVTTDGSVVGQHEGFERFTIGQRKGLGIAMGDPYFVTQIDAQSNRVVIGTKEELGRKELCGRQTNWLVDPPIGQFRCLAQIRYNSAPQPASAEIIGADQLAVHFDNPQYGISPGQAVVCFDDDRVLGGGWID
jgi:tRNA-uridine 2-sulfurtransferase